MKANTYADKYRHKVAFSRPKLSRMSVSKFDKSWLLYKHLHLIELCQASNITFVLHLRLLKLQAYVYNITFYRLQCMRGA
jgi:hypothetical protein